MAINGNKIQVIHIFKWKKVEIGQHMYVKEQEDGSQDIMVETNRSEILEAVLALIKHHMLNHKQGICNYIAQMQCL